MARCPTCEQPSTWTGSSGLKTDSAGTEYTTDTYQCAGDHSWSSTVTYE